MESTAVIAGWQSPRLQKMRINPKTAAVDAEIKEEKSAYH